MDEVIGRGEKFALIIADPPWVPSADTGQFPEDPLLAIDGGADGLAVVHTCLALISEHLADGGGAVVQIGTPAQMVAVERHLRAHASLGLEVTDSRRHRDRGVLILVARTAVEPATSTV